MKNTREHRRPDPPNSPAKNKDLGPDAFTIVELLVILALLAMLGSALFPALARTKPNTQAFQCLNNNRRLCVAWRAFAEDNLGRLVYASDNPSTQSNLLNDFAWTRTHMDFSPSVHANWDTNVDIIKGPLWPYSGGNASIYKCPSDRSFVLVDGERKPRVRSMSMNLYLGGFAGTDGGWGALSGLCIYTNLSQVSGGGLPSPGPSKLFIFLDMHPLMINWGNFATD